MVKKKPDDKITKSDEQTIATISKVAEPDKQIKVNAIKLKPRTQQTNLDATAGPSTKLIEIAEAVKQIVTVKALDIINAEATTKLIDTADAVKQIVTEKALEAATGETGKKGIDVVEAVKQIVTDPALQDAIAETSTKIIGIAEAVKQKITEKDTAEALKQMVTIKAFDVGVQVLDTVAATASKVEKQAKHNKKVLKYLKKQQSKKK